ncbi:hypothetical protein DCAR_0727443 [Daucus carota subsp. sativus]|uniref:Uncharacterized protein n=1 Tax=Daucus carota subsp. sativus TaxID=79200 RepID=A0A161X318_DAUCS|nr:hypothetical protein DCAR_0727443 [Daucus carota subsp. sativus]
MDGGSVPPGSVIEGIDAAALVSSDLQGVPEQVGEKTAGKPDKKLADERLKFDGEIAGIRGERDAFCQRVEMLENELQKVTDQFTGIQSERDTMKTAYSSLERANIDLTENLREVGIARDKRDGSSSALSGGAHSSVSR